MNSVLQLEGVTVSSAQPGPGTARRTELPDRTARHVGRVADGWRVVTRNEWAARKKMQNEPKLETFFKHHSATGSGQSGTPLPRSLESGLPGLKSLKGKRLRDMSFEDD